MAAQDKFLIFQVTTATISSLASSLMAFKVIRTTNGGLKSPYRRIIFGLCVSDIFQSVGLLTGPWSMVPGPFALWGTGNTHTCRLNGAIVIYGSSSVPMYTSALCVFYLCKLKRRMSDETFAHKIEWKMHAFIVLFNSVLTFTALGLKIIHNAAGSGSFCYVAPFPSGCAYRPDLVGECNETFQAAVRMFLIIHPIIYFLSTLVIVGCLAVILYQHSKREMIFPPRGQPVRAKTGLCPSALSNKDTRPEPSQLNNHSYGHTHEEVDPAYSDITKIRNKHGNNVSKEDGQYANSTVGNRKDQFFGEDVLPRVDTTMTLQQSDESKLTRTGEGASLEDLSRLVKKETVIQACSYAGSFFLSYIPVIFFVIGSFTGYQFPHLRTVWSLLYPLGGFFNILVYMRPKAVLFRFRYPQFSLLQAFWFVFKSGGDVPDLLVQMSAQMLSSDDGISSVSTMSRPIATDALVFDCSILDMSNKQEDCSYDAGFKRSALNSIREEEDGSESVSNEESPVEICQHSLIATGRMRARTF